MSLVKEINDRCQKKTRTKKSWYNLSRSEALIKLQLIIGFANNINERVTFENIIFTICLYDHVQFLSS